MRAMVYQEYGPPEVLRAAELPEPAPSGDQVLIRVHATTVTSAETGMRQGLPRWGRIIIGPFKPRRGVRVLGLEFAGEVVTTGPAAQRYRPGDRVFGFTGFALGANAEYLCLSERASMTTIPNRVTYAEAAASVDGFTTAWHFLRRVATVEPGQKVLVIGASGSIGTYAVQIAAQSGAVVHGVCSGRNAALVTSLGAARVFDHTSEDFTVSGERYDVVFDTVTRSSYRRCRPVLARKGVYLPTTGLANTALEAVTALTRGRRVRTGMSVRKHAALAELRDLLAADRLRVVIDRSYPLLDLVEAHRYVGTGRKTGNVVITVGVVSSTP
ncbi:alcohol dehydrogenase [Actinoplanes philippinensis]|uniref:NADPH2:quinone reductase n=1 Tax=Actinoplanes philippinensis TaxID=35752 RepID=A0A1I2GGA3_9ACTN|nr:NAD(P)-dependent alcohol dehydrogenase [Actinoplanes philippinensis]GIE76919.1 alcohol dehydrogenase [Actinoplanes philippinensis]SFF16248.1 NADPH2:quinone reductase [Actinoplanes philippinensis]